MLKRKDILNGKMRVGVKRVDVPVWGEMFVRQVKASDNDLLQELDSLPQSEGLVRFVIMAVCDEDGNQFFEEDDAERLMEAPLAPLKILSEAFLEFNGMGDQDALEKNLEATPTA